MARAVAIMAVGQEARIMDMPSSISSWTNRRSTSQTMNGDITRRIRLTA